MIEWIKEHLVEYLSILGVGLVGAFAFLWKHWYALKCSAFYRIPEKYFLEDKLGFAGSALAYFLVIFGCIILCCAIKKMMHNSDVINLIAYYLFKFFTCVTVSYLAIDAWSNYLALKLYKLGYGLVNIIYVFAFVVFCYGTWSGIEMFMVHWTQRNNTVQNDTENNSQEEGCSNNKRYGIVACVLVAFTLCLVLGGIIVKALYSCELKKQYEGLKIESEEYVVLSEYEGKLLVVKYKNKDKNIIYTSKYKLVDAEDKELYQVNFDTSPIIK